METDMGLGTTTDVAGIIAEVRRLIETLATTPGATGERRREACRKYLKAMKVVLDQGVPGTLGERPGISPALQVPDYQPYHLCM